MPNTPSTKTCVGACKKPLPATDEFFGKKKGTPDGLRERCRHCTNKAERDRLAATKAPAAPVPTSAAVTDELLMKASHVDPVRWPSVQAFEKAHLDIIAEVEADFEDERKDRAALAALAVEPVRVPAPAPKIVAVQETITQIEEHRLKKRLRDLEDQNRKLVEQLSDGGEYAEVVKEVLAKQGEAPPARIDPRERKSGIAEATPLVLASDWHVEEEVRFEQVAGRNRYNIDIATRRMERFFEASMWAVKHQREVFKIRDMIGWWGGDLLTNFLHEDDVENNQLAPLDTILFLQTNLIKGIDYWLTDPEIERFIFPTNDGNHGRLTKKMRNATRREHSLEVFLYAQLAHHYRNEPRIKFMLPTSQFTFLDDVYGRTIRFLHGDVFKYAGGVGGITIPLMKALARWESVKHADLTCMGHWHQRICLPNVMVNGSLIGYNAYAMGGGFPFEAPVQSLRMLEPRRWCSSDVPLWVSERADDSKNAAA